MHPKRSCIAILVILIATTFIFGENSSEEKTKALYQSQEKPIVFYGKIVDQFDQAISGANIDFKVWSFTEENTSFTKIHMNNLLSNEEGEFMIEGLTGRKLLIKSISKEGFSFPFGKNKSRTFYFGNLVPSRIHSPNSGSPIKFILDKE